MYPEFNLLYKNPPKFSPSNEMDMSAKSLLLDEMIMGVTVDIILQKKIFNLLKYPEQDLENIIHRREIIKDFNNNPSLLHEFELLKEKNDVIKDAIKIVKTSTASIITTTGGRTEKSDRESSIFTVQTIADCIVKTLEMYIAYDKTFGRATVKSELLVSMRDFIKKQISNPAFNELMDIAKNLAEAPNASSSYVILAKLDKYIRISDCEMFDITSDPYHYEKGSIPVEDKQKDLEYIGFDVDSDQQLQFFAERSMIKLTEFMESIVIQLKAPFDKVEEGFYFYRFADLLYRMYERLGLPSCLPEYSENENRFECTDIYDLWFCLKQYRQDKTKKPGDTLTPNDAIIPKDCAAYIVTGKNNAGKTVFLRAVGLIQILAQAGLPVPCKSALITPVCNLFAYFTALDIGQGRFEEEVETLSNYLDLMKPNDMLLFNEVYQSTSYDEASIALSEFIGAAAFYGARVISVTHLPDMKKNLDIVKDKIGFKGMVKYMKTEEKDGNSTYKFIEDK